jgi:hypothetical protein
VVQAIHKAASDVEHVEVDGGWFDLLDYGGYVFVVHIEAEPGKGLRVINSLRDYARERNADIWGEINPKSRITPERLIRLYEHYGLKLRGEFNGHPLMKWRVDNG